MKSEQLCCHKATTESQETHLAKNGNGPPRGRPVKGFRDGYLHRPIPNAGFLESIIESVITVRQRD